MHNFAKLLTERIVPDEYKNDPEQIEVAAYGMEGLLCNITTVSIAFIVSFLFQTTKELCLFLLFFVPLRSSYKSFHCKTFINCMVLSNVVVFIATSIIQNTFYFTGIELISLSLCWFNYYLSYERNILLHIFISLFIGIVFLIYQTYLMTIMISLFINTILLLLKRGENNEKL